MVDIKRHVAARFVLYKGQNVMELSELGTGEQGGIQVKGVQPGEIRPGDCLVS